MRRKLNLFAVATIALGLISGTAVITGEDDPPPVYELQLVYIFEAPETEFVFVIGNSGFRSVASLENFIASLPPGTTIQWNPGCLRLGGEPLLSSESEMAEFQAFCLEHQIRFELVPSG